MRFKLLNACPTRIPTYLDWEEPPRHRRLRCSHLAALPQFFVSTHTDALKEAYSRHRPPVNLLDKKALGICGSLIKGDNFGKGEKISYFS